MGTERNNNDYMTSEINVISTITVPLPNEVTTGYDVNTGENVDSVVTTAEGIDSVESVDSFVTTVESVDSHFTTAVESEYSGGNGSIIGIIGASVAVVAIIIVCIVIVCCIVCFKWRKKDYSESNEETGKENISQKRPKSTSSVKSAKTKPPSCQTVMLKEAQHRPPLPMDVNVRPDDPQYVNHEAVTRHNSQISNKSDVQVDLNRSSSTNSHHDNVLTVDEVDVVETTVTGNASYVNLKEFHRQSQNEEPPVDPDTTQTIGFDNALGSDFSNDARKPSYALLPDFSQIGTIVKTLKEKIKKGAEMNQITEDKEDRDGYDSGIRISANSGESENDNYGDTMGEEEDPYVKSSSVKRKPKRLGCVPPDIPPKPTIVPVSGEYDTPPPQTDEQLKLISKGHLGKRPATRYVNVPEHNEDGSPEISGF